MALYKLIIILSGIAAGISQLAARELDSLLADRQNKLQAYTLFRDQMEERTWINLIDLNQMAGAVISADNDLLDHHLEKEMARVKELNAQNEKLRLEMAFLNKEKESRRQQMKEQQSLNNLFIMVILGLFIAFIIVLTLLIIHFRRNRQAIYELERLWSMNDDATLLQKEKEKELIKQIRLLEVENKAMQKELMMHTSQKAATPLKPEEEIKSRQKAEQEIRELSGPGKKK